MDNQKKLIRFFPFALTRIERLRDYLNRMYAYGYQIVKIKFGCILIFQKAAAKEGFKYFILTRHFYSKARVKKLDDVDLLENISPRFHKGNGEQFHVYVWLSSAMYYIYLTRHIPEADYEKIIAYRKKHLFKANAMKIGFWLLLIALLIYNIYICCV